MTTYMDIVVGCEQYLGWMPSTRNDQEPWKVYQVEVWKLKTAIANSKYCPKKLGTIANLALALEYSRHRKLALNSPLALLSRIAPALEIAAQAPVYTPIEKRIQAAIAWEKGRDDEHSLRWMHRLVRSSGSGRAATLDDWKDAGRG